MINETAGTNPAKKGKKEYDLNANDKFWLAQKGSPFPAVAEAVQVELEAYRNSEDEIKRLKHAMVSNNFKKYCVMYEYFKFILGVGS